MAVRTSTKWWAGLLIAWTSYIWVNRLVNAWAGDESSTARVASTITAAIFCAFVVATVVIVVRRWRERPSAGEVKVLLAFCFWTAVVWMVRAVGIVLADHTVAFKAVHVALGALSILLAVGLAQSLVARSPDRGSGLDAPGARR